MKANKNIKKYKNNKFLPDRSYHYRDTKGELLPTESYSHRLVGTEFFSDNDRVVILQYGKQSQKNGLYVIIEKLI